MQTGTRKVIDYLVNCSFDSLPSSVRHQSKRCLLDALGALIAGAETPVGRLMTRFATECYGGDHARVLVHGDRASVVGAALANGFSANALDIDDGYRNVKGHPGACMLPVLLTASEIAPQPVSGKEFLAKLAASYEIAIRAGLIQHVSYESYHASGSWGAVAGAAAAGAMIGLSVEQIAHAMGAAEYHAPISPMMKCIWVPSMPKDGIGWGVMVAMSSAMMARMGFTGIESYFSDDRAQPLVESLGEKFEILNLYFKPYAACRWGQPGVRGAIKIVNENEISPEKIKKIRVLTFQAARELPLTMPRDTEEAQYSMAFPVAAALLYGEVGPRQVLQPPNVEPALVDLVGKLETGWDEECENAFPGKAYAKVEVDTTDGRTLQSGLMEASWEPPDTLPSDEELEKKFRWLAGPVLGDAQTGKLVDLIWKCDELERFGDILDAAVR